VSRYRDGDPDSLVIDQVDLEVAAGELAVLTGVSGAGKTTALRLAAGLDFPNEGVVSLLGRDVGRLRASSRQRLRRRIGYAPQDPPILWDRSVLENVAIALTVAGERRGRARARATTALAALGLGGDIDARPSSLSAGARQLVSLARALVVEPDVLLVDEPTAYLDATSTGDVLHVLLDAAELGAAVLVATTDSRLTDAAEHRELRVLELVNGHLEYHGDTDQSAQPIVLANDNVVPFPLRVAASAGGQAE